jgi:hypothetical protein
MYFVFIYENRVKSVEIALRSGKGREGRRMEGMNLTKYLNITTYPLVQLLYANKNFKYIYIYIYI